MVAAMARSRGADGVATRNTAAFERCGVTIVQSLEGVSFRVRAGGSGRDQSPV